MYNPSDLMWLYNIKINEAPSEQSAIETDVLETSKMS